MNQILNNPIFFKIFVLVKTNNFYSKRVTNIKIQDSIISKITKFNKKSVIIVIKSQSIQAFRNISKSTTFSQKTIKIKKKTIKPLKNTKKIIKSQKYKKNIKIPTCGISLAIKKNNIVQKNL